MHESSWLRAPFSRQVPADVYALPWWPAEYNFSISILRSFSLKLAEALAERSDCQNRIAELNKRMARSARVQEGEVPPEDPVQLLAEFDRLYARLLELVQSINRTNARTPFDGALTISDAIAERDLAGKKRDHLAALAEAASTRQDRYSKSEVKFISTVSIANLQQQADQLAKRFREFDTRIQELNWSTELV